MGPLTHSIPLNKSLDGARILFRNFLSTQAPKEGWVREFSKDENHVRISRTNSLKDFGLWFRVYDLRVGAVLDEARAPEQPKDGQPGFVYKEDL